MYVRFVVDGIDPKSGEPLGIFQAMYRLGRSGSLLEHEEAWWNEVRRWFNARLDEPSRFARSRSPTAAKCAISWFKAGSVQHIARAREVVALLEEHGIRCHMVKTDRPGYVVHEDDFQVVAEPFRGERRRAWPPVLPPLRPRRRDSG
jgi:hypothetical protein